MSDESQGWQYQKTALASVLNISELPDMEAMAGDDALDAMLLAMDAEAGAKPSEPYGDVNYGDPGYRGGKKRYPLSSPEKIRAAWSYIHMPKNASKYTSSQLAHIKAKIVAAWKKHIDPKGPPEAKKS